MGKRNKRHGKLSRKGDGDVRPVLEWVECGGEEYFAVDYTEGGFPIGLSRDEMEAAEKQQAEREARFKELIRTRAVPVDVEMMGRILAKLRRDERAYLNLLTGGTVHIIDESVDVDEYRSIDLYGEQHYENFDQAEELEEPYAAGIARDFLQSEHYVEISLPFDESEVRHAFSRHAHDLFDDLELISNESAPLNRRAWALQNLKQDVLGRTRVVGRALM